MWKEEVLLDLYFHEIDKVEEKKQLTAPPLSGQKKGLAPHLTTEVQ